MNPASFYVTCAGREIHYMDWQPAAVPTGEGAAAAVTPRGTVIAWHGLARTGRDMDPLAKHLVKEGWRVICPDTLGRGLSQWSPDPHNEYCLAFYSRIASELLDRLNLNAVHWVGTSMGGAIGTMAATGVLKDRIRSLVLNDNAPELAHVAIDRIRAYAGQPPAFDTVIELEAFFRKVYEPYGWLSDAEWRQLTESSTRRLPNGKVTPHYDPAMVQQFVNYPKDYDIWTAYDALQIPVLCLRGVNSDLVSRDVVAQMRGRGPGALGRLQVLEVEGCGHAPALNVPAQLEPVARFLADQSHG